MNKKLINVHHRAAKEAYRWGKKHSLQVVEASNGWMRYRFDGLEVYAMDTIADTIAIDPEALARMASAKEWPESWRVEQIKSESGGMYPELVAVLPDGEYRIKVRESEGFEVPEPLSMIEFPADIYELLSNAAHDEYRAVFRGVQFESKRAVATDGFRLAWFEHDFGVKKPVVIEATQIKKAKAFEPKYISFEDNCALLFDNSRTWFIKLNYMEGTLPDYEKVIPFEFFGTLGEFNVEKLKKALNYADKEHMRIDLLGSESIDANGRKIRDVFKVEVGEFPEQDDFLIYAFNGKYLLDALKWAGEGAKMNIGPDSKPCLIYTEGGNRVAIVVPLRV